MGVSGKVLVAASVIIILAFTVQLTHSPHREAGIAKQSATGDSLAIASINISEKGLPNGWPWGFEVYSTTEINNDFGAFASPFSSYIKVWGFTDGAYKLYAGSWINTNLTVMNYLGIINVTGDFRTTIHFYRVNVTESGLPEGAAWGLDYTSRFTSTGQQEFGLYPGTSKNMTVYLPNGTGKFDLNSNVNYHSGPLSYNVTGEPLSLTAHFQKEFQVTFKSRGLGVFSNYTTFVPAGIPIRNNVTFLNNTTISFWLPNGTYNFTFMPNSWQTVRVGPTIYSVDFQPTYENKSLIYRPASFSVNGSSMTINVTYNVSYQVIENLQPPLLENPYFYLAVGGLSVLGIVGFLAFRIRKK